MEFGNINWNLYKSFVAVYEAKNKHRAADRLGITRSAVIQNIQELEKQLGLTLFVSHSRGVEPTDEANTLYTQIKDAIKTLTATEATMQTKKPSTIKMAVASSTAELFINEYLGEFYAKHPDIRIEIFNRAGMDTTMQKQMDFVIDLQHLVNPKDFNVMNIFQNTGVFVSTKDYIEKHKLKENMTIEEILRHPIISRDSAWKEVQKLNPLVKPLDIAMASVDLLYSTICKSVGVGYFVRELLDKIPNHNLKIINVKDFNHATSMHACGYTKTLSKPARAFIDGFVKFCSI